jgi:predicted acyl esterase
VFSNNYGLNLQKRFFDYWLKGEKNGWDKQPPVQLNVRHPGEKFVLRHENEWPLARTQWTKFFLDANGSKLSTTPVAQAAAVEYDATGSGVTFTTAPLATDTEITGPMAAKLFVSSSTSDADLFVIVRVFDPAGRELTFMGSTDPNTPIANGWLRASHRRLDAAKSQPYRPYHPHDRAEPLTPGEVYECEVEIVTSCIVVPAGWRIALTVRGKDYEYEGELSEFGKKFHYGTRGTGGMTHADADNRPAGIFNGKVTLHVGGGRDAYLLLPVIPPKK